MSLRAYGYGSFISPTLQYRYSYATLRRKTWASQVLWQMWDSGTTATRKMVLDDNDNPRDSTVLFVGNLPDNEVRVWRIATVDGFVVLLYEWFQSWQVSVSFFSCRRSLKQLLRGSRRLGRNCSCCREWWVKLLDLGMLWSRLCSLEPFPWGITALILFHHIVGPWLDLLIDRSIDWLIDWLTKLYVIVWLNDNSLGIHAMYFVFPTDSSAFIRRMFTMNSCEEAVKAKEHLHGKVLVPGGRRVTVAWDSRILVCLYFPPPSMIYQIFFDYSPFSYGHEFVLLFLWPSFLGEARRLPETPETEKQCLGRCPVCFEVRHGWCSATFLGFFIRSRVHKK